MTQAEKCLVEIEKYISEGHENSFGVVWEEVISLNPELALDDTVENDMQDKVYFEDGSVLILNEETGCWEIANAGKVTQKLCNLLHVMAETSRNVKLNGNPTEEEVNELIKGILGRVKKAAS